MENNSTYHTDLITKYLAGEAEEDEILLISTWLKTDQSFKKLFDEYKATWNLIERNNINDKIDIEKEWNLTKSRLNGFNTAQTAKVQTTPSIKNKSTGRSIIFKVYRIAAVIILVLFSSIIIYRSFYIHEPVRVFAKLNVIENKLPDGTSVTMNSGSTIEYPKKFENYKREIKFKGEAFFKVAHYKNKPFVIFSDDIRIEVFGTSFYVNTNSDNGNVEVILTTGKVAVYYGNNPDNKIFLQPGEKALASTSKQIITKCVNDDKNFMAWQTKKIFFVNDPLNQIVQTLNKVYHSNIRITDDKASDFRVTATFDNQSLESVLNVLKATVDIKINKTDSIIEISSKPDRGK